MHNSRERTRAGQLPYLRREFCDGKQMLKDNAWIINVFAYLRNSIKIVFLTRCVPLCLSRWLSSCPLLLVFHSNSVEPRLAVAKIALIAYQGKPIVYRQRNELSQISLAIICQWFESGSRSPPITFKLGLPFWINVISFSSAKTIHCPYISVINKFIIMPDSNNLSQLLGLPFSVHTRSNWLERYQRCLALFKSQSHDWVPAGLLNTKPQTHRTYTHTHIPACYIHIHRHIHTFIRRLQHTIRIANQQPRQ